ncbi:MAG: ABC transporter transmembrane domain-containing protein [Chitinophagales bacterium]
MLSATPRPNCAPVVTIIFGVGFIFYISPNSPLLMLATFPVLVLVAVFYGKYIRGLS